MDRHNFHIKLCCTDGVENNAWVYRARVEERAPDGHLQSVTIPEAV